MNDELSDYMSKAVRTFAFWENASSVLLITLQAVLDLFFSYF